MREIVLDTETTGLDPAQGHRLVEIGAVEIVNQIATGATFHALINPEREVPDDAFRVHGHSTASLQRQAARSRRSSTNFSPSSARIGW